MIVMPRFLDVEASSLSNQSYPIEIAWSDCYCNIESYLINPGFVAQWTDWDYRAEHIHGISRKKCTEEGVEPGFICDRMNNSITDGEYVYADGGCFDEHWVNVVFSEGSTHGSPKFKIIHSDVVMLPHLEKIENNGTKRRNLYDSLKTEARKIVGGQHRAEIDVRYLIELYKLCSSMGYL